MYTGDGGDYDYDNDDADYHAMIIMLILIFMTKMIIRMMMMMLTTRRTMMMTIPGKTQQITADQTQLRQPHLGSITIGEPFPPSS